jgi:hypothetical protein
MRRTVLRTALRAALLATLRAAVPAGAAAQTAGWDTLGVRAVLERRRAALDSLLLAPSLAVDTVGIAVASDSLDHGGAAVVRARIPRRAPPRRVRTGVGISNLTTYNRVEGLLLGLGAHAGLGRRLRLDADGAWGFARRHASGRAALRLGPALRVAWMDATAPFGPVPGGSSLGLLALVGGEDRQDYLRRRGTTVAALGARGFVRHLELGLFEQEESSVAAATDFCFVGGRERPVDGPNPAVDEARLHGARFVVALGRRDRAASLDIEAGAARGDFEYAWQEASASFRRVLPTGTTFVLGLGARNLAGRAPAQAAAYLGGDATLRGYERLEFAGRRRLHARLEVPIGVDLLARSRVPLVRRLHVQFIPFGDAGSTWGEPRAVALSRRTPDGDWRSSIGLGMRRVLWLPGVEALRLDVMRRTDRGDDAWSFWLRVVPIDRP